ncbi:MAG TPA: NAD(P)H-dependent oxidoreductase subunit E [Aeromonadales bacterium]|nr:NAD(P)H-dependent oxidoreductase subunit E [Aeromonadales bacterium]
MAEQNKQPLIDLVSAKGIAEMDAWLAKYPKKGKRSAVMGGLMMAQLENNNHLTPELMDAVADYIGIPHMAAYEVATFYSMYNLEPVGKYVINVCTNISCSLRGSDEVLAHLKDRLGIEPGETTDDKQFTIKSVECLGACAGAPMFEVDRVYHENLDKEKINSIIDRLASPAN